MSEATNVSGGAAPGSPSTGGRVRESGASSDGPLVLTARRAPLRAPGTARALMRAMVVALVVPSSVTRGSEQFTGEQLLDAIVKARQSLRSGDVRFHSVTEEMASATARARQWNWEVRFDGPRLRGDLRQDGAWTVRCVRCEPYSSFIHYSTRFGDRFAVTIQDEKYVNLEVNPIPYARWLGTLPIGSLEMALFHPESVFQVKDGAAETERDTVDGIDCWRVAWNGRAGVRLTAWVAPDRDFAVLKCQNDFGSEKQPVVDLVTSKYEQDKASQRWFVKAWTWTRTKNGEVTRQETGAVDAVALNAPVPAEVFSLRGMQELPPNTPIHWSLDTHPSPCPESAPFWNGEEIACEPTVAEELAAQPANRVRRLLLAGNAAIFLLILAVLLWRRARRSAAGRTVT